MIWQIMNAIGNVIIIIGFFPWLLFLFFVYSSSLIDFIFSCTTNNSTGVSSCVYGPQFIASMFDSLSSNTLIAFFLMGTLPIFLAGYSFLFLAKKDPGATSTTTTLDRFVSGLNRFVLLSILLLFAIALWQVTIVIYIYQAIKTKSFVQPFFNIKNIISNNGKKL